MSHRKGPMHSFDGDPLDNKRSDIWKRFGFNQPKQEDRDMFFETSTPPVWGDLQSKFHRSEPEWRNRSMFSEPGSSSPSFPHRMRMGNSKWVGEHENGIPIRVMHEHTPPPRCSGDEGTDSETSSQASHGSQGSGGSSGQAFKAKITREPRVHHIPIMVEPRDGSTSSGYASDSGGNAPGNNHHATNPATVAGAGGGAAQNAFAAELQHQQQQDVRKRTYPGETQLRKQSSAESATSDNGDYYQQPNVSQLRRSFEHRNPEDGVDNPNRGFAYPQQQEAPSSNARQIPVKVINIQTTNEYQSSPQSKPTRSFSDNSFGINPGPFAPPRQRKASSHPPMSPPSMYSTHPPPHSGPHVTKTHINVPVKPETTEQHPSNSSNSSNNTTTSPSEETNKKSKKKLDPIQQIANVLKEKEQFGKLVEEYQGTTQDKQYRYLDEMLTRCMIKLDTVETDGKDDVRQARKAAVRDIESCINILESKLTANVTMKNKEMEGNNMMAVDVGGSMETAVQEGEDGAKRKEDDEIKMQIEDAESANNATSNTNSTTTTSTSDEANGETIRSD